MGDGQSHRAVDVGRADGDAHASRKRAAVELIRLHERTLRRTARRYSLCADDAEDALQRALEILLTKAPTSDQRQLIRWMQTVTKHEALAVRRTRERNLGAPAMAGRDEDGDWIQMIPSEGDGPMDQAARRERIGRAREALKALKPQELRALTLLAQGYSYAEIGEMTGWTYTKVNRCLAEGRQRFRAVLDSIEGGRRCEELAPLLSAFVDGEARSHLTMPLLAHLRECAHCRAEVRAYRAAPRAAAALAPALPALSAFRQRLYELAGAVHSRLPGRSGAAETAATQLAAAGGTKGNGMALAAKILAACVGTAGGAAACVASGVVPPVTGVHDPRPQLERVVDGPSTPSPAQDPAPTPSPMPSASQSPETTPSPAPPSPAPPSSPPQPQPSAEFSPEVTPAPPVSGSPSGEFGGGAAPGSTGGAGAAARPGGEFGP